MTSVEPTYVLQDVPEGEFKAEGFQFRIFDFSAWVNFQPTIVDPDTPRPRGVRVSLNVAGDFLHKIFHGTESETAEITPNGSSLVSLNLYRTDDITSPFTWRLPSLEFTRIPHGVEIRAKNGPLWNPGQSPAEQIKCFVVLHVLGKPLKSPVVTLQKVF